MIIFKNHKRYTLKIVSFFIAFGFNSCRKESKALINLKKPNVLLIVADDLGWKDLGVNGSLFYETPNIDALARGAEVFTNGYASCPVCSPSRASIQTGLYPTNVNVTDWIPGRAKFVGVEETNRWIANEMNNELDRSFTTIAEVLKTNNYKTFFAGKWHLGEKEIFWPENRGYEINKGGHSKGRPFISKKNNSNGYFSPYNNPRLKDGPKDEYLTDRLGDETIKFISQNKETPFFISLSFYQVHTPLQAKKEHIKKYKVKKGDLGLDTIQEFIKKPEWIRGNLKNKSFKERQIQSNPTYAGMVQSLDENIGKVINKLKELGLYESTLIIFTSDNGGLSSSGSSPTTNAPLRGGKGWLFEGGIRVPFMVKVPNQTKKGKINKKPVSGIDIFPTILNCLNISSNGKVDGQSLLSDTLSSRSLFWHYPHYSNQGGNPGSAIRKGKYKLIHDFETGEKLLFNLEEDIAEQNNLAISKPNLTKALYTELDNWRNKNNGIMMRPNPTWNKNERIVE